ncbi:phospho-acceptor domain-containing protein [Roseimicrobium gellanilyticum]|uniref:histidine kinase n=2 Tax=Roseimicrobium gellanilyticum TaxID=748857 RepID=A0A366HMM7_9BACT|nr:phospho-acceptor domain-containing protein [Roseimicrobium gellanilyticum]
MANVSIEPHAGLQNSFDAYERPIRIRNYKLGCILAATFMPLGASVDILVYGQEAMWQWLPIRFLTSGIVMLLWLILHLKPEIPFYRLVGIMAMFVPALCMCWIIYSKDGAVSPYYAALNLVMLGSGIVMRWPLVDSVAILLLTLTAYGIASLAHGTISDWSIFYNNVYFLLLTGAIIVAGTWQYNAVRRSEFDLRYRLDQNREELERTNQKLREMDEVKSRFFANISHELRTPLTLLIAPLEAMLSPKPKSDTEQKELLDTMHGNAMRLLKLINDLLDLVRLESGRVQVKEHRVMVKEFVEGIGTAVRAMAKDKRIRLETHVDPTLGAAKLDSEKLERISLNLLSNAMKFTAAGGKVEFNATRDGDWVEFDVRDTGMGIDAAQLPHIFDRFWQADTSSQRKFQGMGIGLALVKELAEAQGGTVKATSEVGRGTTMSVRLPYVDAPEELEEPPMVETPDDLEMGGNGTTQEWISGLYRRAEMFPAITSLQASLRPIETGIGRSRKPKLLIADDEPDMLRFLKSQLTANFEVLEAVDGLQAVEKAAQFLPDIILSDMMMPEKDGLQVCRELRERVSTRSIPIVLLTARADEKTKMDCLQAGASDFLGKPFSLTEISVRLKNLVDSHLYQRELAVQKQQLEAALEQVKETEVLMVRNEKLAALGRMSAGLIHEINNPLNYASQGLHLLGQVTDMLPESERADFADTLKDVHDGVKRVARIISDLRGFTRMTHETSQVFEFKPVAETVLRFFSHEWKDGIAAEIHVPEGMEVRGDSNQIVQVLVNLVQNSIDAMRTKQYPDGESPLISISAAPAGSKVMVTLRDNGPGISEEIRNKVFDPFFTTKDVGSGMGLGLSICHRIVSEHGGRIDVRSQPGVFTEFELEFPSPDARGTFE